MFFFLFAESNRFKRGEVCELIANDPRREARPDLYEDRIGKRVIVDELDEDNGWVWAYEDRPARYRINKRGKRVCEYDPRCVTKPYKQEWLKVLDGGTVALNRELIFDEGTDWS